jgi:hypothetical protein
MDEVLSWLKIVLAFIISVGSTAVGISAWFHKKMERLAKLERAVFDGDGNERYIAAKPFNERLENIEKAVVLMNKAQMRYIHAVIDLLPPGHNKDRLVEVRDELSDERSIL